MTRSITNITSAEHRALRFASKTVSAGSEKITRPAPVAPPGAFAPGS